MKIPDNLLIALILVLVAIIGFSYWHDASEPEITSYEACLLRYTPGTDSEYAARRIAEGCFHLYPSVRDPNSNKRTLATE